jgi:hypothetical protein
MQSAKTRNGKAAQKLLFRVSGPLSLLELVIYRITPNRPDGADSTTGRD